MSTLENGHSRVPHGTAVMNVAVWVEGIVSTRCIDATRPEMTSRIRYLGVSIKVLNPLIPNGIVRRTKCIKGVERMGKRNRSTLSSVSNSSVDVETDALRGKRRKIRDGRPSLTLVHNSLIRSIRLPPHHSFNIPSIFLELGVIGTFGGGG